MTLDRHDASSAAFQSPAVSAAVKQWTPNYQSWCHAQVRRNLLQQADCGWPIFNPDPIWSHGYNHNTFLDAHQRDMRTALRAA